MPGSCARMGHRCVAITSSAVLLLSFRFSIPLSIRLTGLLCVLVSAALLAQRPSLQSMRRDAQGRPMGAGSQMKGGDSLQRRDNNADSITIYYRLFDSSRILFIDSTVGEFHRRFTLKPDMLFLGSLGAPATSLLFQPLMRPGFDHGFHAYDAYRYTVEGTRIFQTTRPYSELDYILGSRSEQTINVLHTQNLKPTWNASFEYRYLGSPGNFKGSNTSHSNMRLASGFSTRNRRYSGNFIYISNRNRASQNGGILSDSLLAIDNGQFNNRGGIDTWLGGDAAFSTNFFSTAVRVGHDYRQQQLYWRHQYDFGQKDSLVNEEDSSVTRLFYPRFRVQHSISYQTMRFLYNEGELTDTSLTNDYANVYRQRFGVSRVAAIKAIRDQWTDLTNEAAVLAYPQKNNQDQFLKAGAGMQLLQGRFDTAGRASYTNLYLLGEYRNRTRNRRWDINAHGRLYLSGLNAGDYTAAISLQTSLGKKAGILQLGFQNSNRTPSFVFDTLTSFINESRDNNLRPENWTRLSGNYYLPSLQLHLLGNYYLVSNYTYWNSYTTRTQEATLQTVLHLGAEKKIKLAKKWNWYAELHLQTETSDVINLPLVYTRHRVALETVVKKNMNLSTGLEIRYFTPFTANDFSPMNGQWLPQDTVRISNRPDIAAYLNFRIRAFRLYTRVENLNTIDPNRGFGFLANNMAAPLYPTPGLFIRFGIYWSFVN